MFYLFCFYLPKQAHIPSKTAETITKNTHKNIFVTSAPFFGVENILFGEKQTKNQCGIKIKGQKKTTKRRSNGNR